MLQEHRRCSPPMGPMTLADIHNTPHPWDCVEPPALLLAPGHQDYLVRDLPAITEPFDKCLSLVLEKVFLLPVCPAGFPPDKDDGGFTGRCLLSFSDSRNLMRSTMKALYGVGMPWSFPFSTTAPLIKPISVVLLREMSWSMEEWWRAVAGRWTSRKNARYSSAVDHCSRTPSASDYREGLMHDLTDDPP